MLKEQAATNRFIPLLQIMRIFHWPKNFLIFIPIIAAHKILNFPLVMKLLPAFLSFSLCASGAYCLTDFLDVQADRQHPSKRFRPFAQGTISTSQGLPFAFLLITASILISTSLLPVQFVLILMTYLLVTVSYALYFKKIVVLDVLTLTGLYALRIFAGGAATAISISNWLLVFSIFLFLSLAFMKRHAELLLFKTQGQTYVPLRGYRDIDIPWIRKVGMLSGYLSVVVFGIYLNSHDVTLLYSHPYRLWLICPFLLYWISRLWYLAYHGNIDDDPVVATLKDSTTYGVAVLVSMILFVSS